MHLLLEFGSYLKSASLRKSTFLVALDRPGWGKSQLDTTDKIGDFSYQAGAVIKIMQAYPNKKWIIVGHSLGASIAPYIALTQAQSIHAFVLLAGSLSPKLGSARWYNIIAHNKLAYWLLPHALEHSNREIMALKKQLTILNSSLKNKNLPIAMTVIQGKKDTLVSPKNAEYAKTHWNAVFAPLRVITLRKQGHFIPWRKQEEVEKAIQFYLHNNAIDN